MAERDKVLLLLECGHTLVLYNHVPGDQVPLLGYCDLCQQPMIVEDHVSTRRERGPDGRA